MTPGFGADNQIQTNQVKPKPLTHFNSDPPQPMKLASNDSLPNVKRLATNTNPSAEESKQLTGNDDAASDNTYQDDFESSWAASESAYNFDGASASYKSGNEFGGSLRQRNNSQVGMPKTKEEEMEDLLLQEARGTHAKLRA